MMKQRSCDSLLGVPFNFTSEALKLKMVANILGYKPGIFTHVLGDAHIYCGKGARSNWYGENLQYLKREVLKCESPQDYQKLKNHLLEILPNEDAGAEGLDHIPYVLEQLSRQDSGNMPTIEFVGEESKNINKIDLDNIIISGYKSEKALKLPCKSLEGKLIKPKMAA